MSRYFKTFYLSNLHPFAHRIASDFHPVVDYDPQRDVIAAVDLSPDNPLINPSVTANTASFSAFILNELKKHNARYLVGGYNEWREIYRRSRLFDENLQGITDTEEPRNRHLGIDIWGPVGTVVYAPIGGSIHSFAYNNNFGDYGATIILQHQIDGFVFYSLYGHLSRPDLDGKRVGQFLSRGEAFASFGPPAENGDWPPHLHFQLIIDIGEWLGDYPGVCKSSEADIYLFNSPDPDLVLDMRRHSIPANNWKS